MDIEKMAQEIWEQMDDNQRFGCQFMMFPAELMPKLNREDSRKLAVALGNLAKSLG